MLPGGQDQWKLVWSDEFDYPDAQLDGKWASQNGPSGHILSSRWRENAKVEDGTLKLINRKEERGGQKWTSGNIWTKEKFQYGYFECRYRYAAVEATNNSFWIMSQDEHPPERGSKFEIDINEGHFPSTVNTNIHDWTNLVERNGKKRSRSSPKAFPYGVRPDRVVQLETPITTKKIRLVSNHGKHFHIRELRAFGVNAGKGYPSIFDPVPTGDAFTHDFARDTDSKVTVSGLFSRPDAPPNDAQFVRDNEPKTSWISQSDGEKSVEVEFAQPRTIGCVQFLNGYQSDGSWLGMLTDYRVQYDNGTEWVDLQVFDLVNGEQNFAREFNVFGLDWSEQELVFYLNGIEIRRVKNEFCFSPAPILLSLTIISWQGRITDAIDGTFMEVDYVRVYKHP